MYANNAMTRNATVIAAALGAAMTSIAAAQFTFDPATNVPAGVRPGGVAILDVDNDGDLDIATTVDNPDRVVFLVNNSGVFSAGGSVILPNSSSPSELLAGDLDGDGDADLAVILRDNNAVITVINNGGAFATGAQASVGSNARGMAMADVDNDGDLDIAVANRDSNTATVLTNNGNATFASSTLNAGLEPRAAAFSDFDMDGDMDLAVTNHDDRTVSIFTQSPIGFSASATLNVGGGVRPEGAAGADFDGDGDGDLAVTADGFVALFLADGGSFSGPFLYPTGQGDASTLHAADLDCDGLKDLVVTHDDAANVVTLMRNTGGAFGAGQALAAGTRPGEIGTGDLDSDGDLDIVVANRDSNDISVLINQGDCDGGGDPGPSPCPEDLNGDNAVDVFDLLELLSAWGACPE